MTREELDRLRALASKATPGEWEWSDSRLIVRHGDQVTHFVLYPTHEYETGCDIEGSIDDLDYIAAANPSTITALLDHIDRLEREVNECRKILVDALQENERLNKKAWTLDAMMEAYDTATKETASE